MGVWPHDAPDRKEVFTARFESGRCVAINGKAVTPLEAMLTANEIGGDYYDFLPLPDGRLALIVGDASGHGLAAGLLMGIAVTSWGSTGPWLRRTWSGWCGVGRRA